MQSSKDITYDGLNRKEYIDIPHNSEPPPGEFDFVEPKFDGIWCRLVIQAGQALFYSRTNNLKETHTLSPDEAKCFVAGTTTLLGEFMYGQEWALAEGRAGRFYAFDVLAKDGKDISHLPLADRKRVLKGILPQPTGRFYRIPTYPVSLAPTLWHEFVRLSGGEGLVYLKAGLAGYSTDLLARRKGEYTDDLYIVGFYEGDKRLSGSLGGVKVAKHLGGPEVCSVGGGFSDDLRDRIWRSRDEYLGKCITVKSNKRFASGSLRSPNFVCFHQEK
jgi:ATP-dependent DNA ligase